MRTKRVSLEFSNLLECCQKWSPRVSEICARERCDWTELTCSSAARYGHLECLKYAHENGCPWNDWTCRYAAADGHLGGLKYAHENGCRWGTWTCSQAALYGYLECLKYAHENRCPWNEQTCFEAAVRGHLECLKYARENGCPWDKWTCSGAAREGHLEVFEICARKRMSLGSVDLYLCCPKWSTRVFEIRAREGCPGSAEYAHHLLPAQTHE